MPRFHVEQQVGIRLHLAASLEALDASSAEAQALAGPLSALACMTARWANRMNLTGPRTPEELSALLLVPPFAWAKWLPPAPRTIADLGSGAGFPGFPLALRFPSARIYLVEARERRHHFQRAVCRELSLSHVEPLLGRIEALPPRRCDVVVAQALAPPPRALALMRKWASPGATLAIPLGLDAAAPPDVDLEASRVVSYPIPGSSRRGGLWLGRMPR